MNPLIMEKPLMGFSSAFASVSTSKIVNEIKNKGYFAFEKALDDKYIDEFLEEINFRDILLNVNDAGVVMAQNNKYLTHCLAASEKIYNIVTSEKVLDICREFFTDTFKLTNHRVYQTTKNNHMPWHTDNNKQDGKKLSGKHSMPGLLFLFYLSDVDKNAFQFIQSSHKWSEKYDNEIYLSDDYIETKYQKDILTFAMKKGTLILCDIHGIHRAEPFADKNYKRTTLLFQVDQVGAENEGHGEKNLVNTEFLKNLSPEVMDYLGFGFKRSYPAFPNSSLATLTLQDIVGLQKQLFSKTISGITKNIVKAILPAKTIINAKRMKWNMKTKSENKARLKEKAGIHDDHFHDM
jgi:ectoine hydroxylase-related dioxygenase (phytanoyl-CoA dioxygenase family)